MNKKVFFLKLALINVDFSHFKPQLLIRKYVSVWTKRECEFGICVAINHKKVPQPALREKEEVKG